MMFMCNKCGVISKTDKIIEHGKFGFTVHPNKPKPSESCDGKFIKVGLESFEEKFPSLTAYDRGVCPVYSESDLNRVCTVAQIERCCLDKVRVKEVIEKILKEKIWDKTLDEENKAHFAVKDCKKDLFKELGL